MSSRRDSTEEQKVPRKNSSRPTDATLCERLEEYVPIEEPKGGGICIFCDEYNENFTDENLISHNRTECPLWTKCRLCNKILEISTLDDHMLLCESEKQKDGGICIFCNEYNENFTEEYLVTHYWAECPVLTKCRLCNIVSELFRFQKIE